MTGRWRIYFNRKGDPEEAWSLDTGHGTQRYNLKSVSFAVYATTRLAGTEPDGENPVAWLEAHGQLQVVNGRGFITWAPELKIMPKRGESHGNEERRTEPTT